MATERIVHDFNSLKCVRVYVMAQDSVFLGDRVVGTSRCCWVECLSGPVGRVLFRSSVYLLILCLIFKKLMTGKGVLKAPAVIVCFSY